MKARQAQERTEQPGTPEAEPAGFAAPPEPAANSDATPVVKPEPERARDELSAPTAPVADRGPPLHPELEVVGFAASGVLPKVGPGLAAELGLERGHFRVGVLGRYWVPRTTPVAQSRN